MDNLLLATDSYKVTHHYQYPDNTQYIYSYFESRGGKFPTIVFFGLQYIIKKWLVGKVVTEEKIREAKGIYDLHFGSQYFNEDGWRYILEKHDGHLPLRIKAVPEGSVLPVKNVLFTVENTDPQCYWLTNYLETLLVQCWYPINVATISKHMKTIISRHLRQTSDNQANLVYQLHDFGCRGCTCMEAASVGGAGHLVNFRGTDTIASLWMLRRYYHENIAGFSIPATEHSTITSWGKDGELQAFENVLNKFPNGTVACVSDSYDIWQACDNYWGQQLHDQIAIRKNALVIRPDSGEPCEVVPKVLEILCNRFGSHTNKLGYRVLPKCIRVIQGDGIDMDTLNGICTSIAEAGFSLENVAFGCGGGLLQKHNRDTQKCAYKCSYAVIGGENRNVYKDPSTDSGKKSKKGRLTLERKEDGSYVTMEEGSGDVNKDCLVTIFENGHIIRDYTFTEIRKLADESE